MVPSGFYDGNAQPKLPPFAWLCELNFCRSGAFQSMNETAYIYRVTSLQIESSPMASEQIKAKVQGVYLRAVQDRFTQRHRFGGNNQLFRDIRLYGRDAGIDFATTNIDAIVQEAIGAAECKEPSMELMGYGFGQAAVEGMAQTLRDLTGLRVDVKGSNITLVWAEASPGLI